MTPNAAAARFLWRFARPGQDVAHEREMLVPAEDGPRSATVFAPDGWPAGRPAWVLLHGITVPGRHHDALRRIARALAAAGHYAIAPEVPAWRQLHVDPGEGRAAIDAGVAGIRLQTPADPDRIGIIGFSVAGRWGLNEAGLAGTQFRAAASMGGYADIERTLVAMVSGIHDWAGERFQYDPDPYGRWIMGANLLRLVEGDMYGTAGERAAAADALLLLARTAGQNGAMARTAVYDALNASLRASLPTGVQTAWDVLAPRSNERASRAREATELARQMAAAAVRRYPLLQDAAGIDRLGIPVVLLHGRADRLIPFTETLRLARELPPTSIRRLTITRLFGHTRSREARPPRNPASRAREIAAFASAIGALLEAIQE